MADQTLTDVLYNFYTALGANSLEDAHEATLDGGAEFVGCCESRDWSVPEEFCYPLLDDVLSSERLEELVERADLQYAAPSFWSSAAIEHNPEGFKQMIADGLVELRARLKEEIAERDVE